MSTKENLNKAVFDMFGVGTDPDSASGAAPVRERPFVPAHTPAPAAPTAAAPAAVTYLAPGTTMEGHLKAKGDVEIAGAFKGDVTAGGRVNLRSSIEGNITAEKLDVISCALSGDVHVSGTVSVDAGSSITGNVFAREFLCAGKIAGNLCINGNATLQKGSQILGDISTGTLTMECGAFINGELTMNTKPAAATAPAAAAPAEKSIGEPSAAENPAAEKPVISVH